MPSEDQKPIIYLAFANDHNDQTRYLRQLNQEYRALKSTLEAAENQGLCRLVIDAAATVETVLDTFTKYRDQIAIFHFAGHANGYQLLLEPAQSKPGVADAGGLAAFLSQQQGLQLVFFNGCATRQQTEGLLRAGVKGVISTVQAIDDTVAMDFADHFYRQLAGGTGLQTAFNTAKAALQTTHGSDTRSVYRGALRRLDEPEVDDWPWRLVFQAGAEALADWSLPEAAADPLFGLPPVPATDLPDSPYRRLDFFTRDHAEVFFGRGYQIRDLYDRVTTPDTPPIILFYGQSGVGKSSLLAAGLLPRLEVSHTIHYARRDQALGILGTLQQALANQMATPPDSTAAALKSGWQTLEEVHQRPFTLILDQLEEVFTRPNAAQPDELGDFLRALQGFGRSAQRPLGKLILGFRKEWLAEIENQMQASHLPRAKVFLNRLDRRGIIEAITGPTHSSRLRDHYGLTIAEELPSLIADDLLADRGSAIAPTLQILLTKLWDQAKTSNYDRPHIDLDLYHSLREQGILLQDFLDQQLARLGTQADLRQQIASGLALDLLASHTTPHGTADQRTLTDLHTIYHHLPQTIDQLLRACQDGYLLVDPARNQPSQEAASRLAHDTLSPLVRMRFDESDKPGQRARRILESRVVEWIDEVGNPVEGTSLDEQDLKLVEDGQNGMRAWTEPEIRLIEASRIERQRRQRRRRFWQQVGAVAVIIILVLGSLAWWQWGLADERADTIVAQSTTEAEARFDADQRATVVATQATAVKEEANRSATQVVVRQTAEAKEASAAATAESRRIEADRQSRVSLAKSLGALAPRLVDITHDYELGVLLAVEAYHINEISQGDGLALIDSGLRDILSRPDFNTIFDDFENDVYSMAFTPDGQTLTFANPFRLHQWQINPLTAKSITLDEIREIKELAVSPKAQYLAAIDRPGNIYLKRLNDSRAGTQLIGQESGRTVAIAFPDEEYLNVLNDEGIIRQWDLREPQTEPLVFQKIEYWPAEPVSRAFYDVAINRQNSLIALPKQPNGIELWDLSQPASTPKHFQGNTDAIENRSYQTVLTIAFSPDGQFVATGSGDYSVQVFDLQADNPEPPLVLQGHRDGVVSLQFSPDSKTLVSGGMDSTLRLWDVGQQAVALPQVLTEADAATISFTPPNVSLNEEGQFVQLEPEDGGHQIQSVFSETLSAATLIPDHDRLAMAGLNQRFMAYDRSEAMIQLLDLTTSDAPSITLRPHEGYVTHLTFSDDGQTLASASIDNQYRPENNNTTFRWWDLTKPDVEPVILGELLGKEKTTIALSADGRALFSRTGWSETVVHHWLTPQGLVEVACQKVRRNLSRAEWALYLPGDTYRQTCPNLPPHPSFGE